MKHSMLEVGSLMEIMRWNDGVDFLAVVEHRLVPDRIRNGYVTIKPRTSVSYNASHHPLATPHQVITETYLGVLCAGTKKCHYSACQVTQASVHKKYFGYNDVLPAALRLLGSQD